MHVWWLTLLTVASTWGWDCGKQEKGAEAIKGFTRFLCLTTSAAQLIVNLLVCIHAISNATNLTSFLALPTPILPLLWSCYAQMVPQWTLLLESLQLAQGLVKEIVCPLHTQVMLPSWWHFELNHAVVSIYMDELWPWLWIYSGDSGCIYSGILWWWIHLDEHIYICGRINPSLATVCRMFQLL